MLSAVRQVCRSVWSKGHGGFMPSSPEHLAYTKPLHLSPHHPRNISTTLPTLTSTSASPPSSNSKENGRRFNVGAFGAGRIGRMHLRNVYRHPRMDLKWVVEDNESMRDLARQELFMYDTPFKPTSSIPALLEDSSLDGVFVLSPTDTHHSLITAALTQGKAVFTEKPTAETRDEIDECYTLAESKGVPLFTGFQRRLDPVFRDVYEAVREKGLVGKVFNIKTVSRDSPKPSYEFLQNTDPDGCNLLSDMAVHDVDTIVWLTATQEPQLIYVVTHAHDEILAERGVDDSMTVLIKYKSGIVATIDTCRETTYGYDMRVEVFGSKGMVSGNNPREATSVVDGEMGGNLRRLYHSFPQRFEKAFSLEIDHFVQCMEGTETPPVTKEQALMTARIIEKGIQSFREKKPVYF